MKMQVLRVFLFIKYFKANKSQAKQTLIYLTSLNISL